MDAVAGRAGYAVDRVARGDGLVRLALGAVGALAEIVGRETLEGAGIVLGLGLATVETNAVFAARIASVGAAKGEPRRFPYTTPNAAAGECAVAFGLTGPAFAVGGGPHGGIEALAVASSLVATGAAERIVVVAADEAGPMSERLAPGTTSGAVALLVEAEAAAGRTVAELEDWTLSWTASGPDAPGALPPMSAHSALVPLAAAGRGGRGRERPTMLEAAVPWGGFAKARLFWL